MTAGALVETQPCRWKVTESRMEGGIGGERRDEVDSVLMLACSRRHDIDCDVLWLQRRNPMFETRKMGKADDGQFLRRTLRELWMHFTESTIGTGS